MHQHLNLENTWPLVRKLGLEVDPDTGALMLSRLPGPPRRIGAVPGTKAQPACAAGIAVGREGTIFVSDPTNHRVFSIDPVSGTATPLGCLCSTAPGWRVGQLHRPQGLAFQACHNRLLIADSGNCRIQVVAPEQQRVVAVWGQTWPHEQPRPCGSSGGLDGPEQIAVGENGDVFVIDRLVDAPHGHGTRAKVVKLSGDGVRTTTTFSCGNADPVHLTIAGWKFQAEDTHCELLFVLAIASRELVLFVFDTDGQPVISRPIPLLGPDVSSPQGFASVVNYNFNATTAWQKDSKTQNQIAGELRAMIQAFTVIGGVAIVSVASAPARVWCFNITEAIENDSPDTVLTSRLPLYDGSAVALGVRGNPCHPDSSADVLLFEGAGQNLFALRNRGAFRSQGAFLAGPFHGNRDQITQWHRLRIDGRMQDQEHLQIFTLSRSERKSGRSGPVRPRVDRIPGWFRVETQPEMFDRMGFAPGEEVINEPDTEDSFPLRRSDPPPDPDLTPSEEWYAIPENQFDGLIRNSGGTISEPCDQLWIFGLVASHGRTSPKFNQIRLEHDEDGWLSQLPEAFQRDPSSRAFARSLLALLESGFEDVTESIDRLPALFSAHGMFSRYGRQSEEVEWLRTALALPTTIRTGNPRKDIPLNIQTFSDGPFWLARRGTPEGLRRLIWISTGVEVVIDEPGLDQVPTRLQNDTTHSDLTANISDSNSERICATTDAAGWPEVIGYSTVFDPDGPKLRLSDGQAHHFVVRGYESDLIHKHLHDAVERTVAAIAPAHNSWSVQVIQPNARVGIQARLGIDSVVARCAPAEPMKLDQPPGPNVQIDPGPHAPTVGAAHLGDHTYLM